VSKEPVRIFVKMAVLQYLFSFDLLIAGFLDVHAPPQCTTHPDRIQTSKTDTRDKSFFTRSVFIPRPRLLPAVIPPLLIPAVLSAFIRK
jgi:hypothetical protein